MSFVFFPNTTIENNIIILLLLVLEVLCEGDNLSQIFTIDHFIRITLERLCLALLYAILLLASKYQALLVILSLCGCIIYSKSLYCFPWIYLLWSNQISNNASQQFDKLFIYCVGGCDASNNMCDGGNSFGNAWHSWHHCVRIQHGRFFFNMFHRFIPYVCRVHQLRKIPRSYRVL